MGGGRRKGKDGGEMPEDVQEALSGLPQEVQDQLGEAQEIQELLGAANLQDVDVEGSATVLGEALQSVVVPQRNFEITFARDAYGPGDAVEGKVAVGERVKGRGLKAELCYVEESPDYVETSVHDSATLLDRAPEPGDEASFVLTLPQGAPPNWDPGGIAQALARGGTADPSSGRFDLASYGRLYWAVVLTVPRRMRSNVVERHPIPLDDDRARWTAGDPGPGSERGEIKQVNKGWDVEIEPDPWALRRGEEVAIEVAIAKPAADRDGLRVGLVCEIHYDVETTSTDADGNHTTSRSTRIGTGHEEWAPIDPSAPRQRVRLRVPEDAPFSYGEGKAVRVGPMTMTKKRRGNAVAIEWKAVATEDRRMRRDPRREAVLQVLP